MRPLNQKLIIFIGLWLAYAYIFPRWLDWNQNSRIDLTAAIVEHGTLSIDAYVRNTGDYAVFGEHAFSDKMPGLSFLAVPVYAATRPFTHRDLIQNLFVSLARNEAVATTLNRPPDQISPDEFQFAANLYLTALIVVALPSALLGVILFSFLGQLGYSAAARALAVIAYGLATPAFSYSGTFYSHQFTATALFIAFAWIHAFRARQPRKIELLLLGVLLGIIVITEVPAVFIVTLLGLYAIWILRRTTWIALMIIGCLPPLIITALYHWSIFGTPFTLAYLHHVRLDWREQFQTGLLSASFLRWGNIWGLTFSPYRGLFFSAPILLLSIPGFWLIARQANWRAEWLLSLVSSIGLLLIFGLSADWNGGYAAGPRYLIPMIPFMVWPLAASLDRIEHAQLRVRHILWLITFCLIAVSILITWSLTVGGQYYTPEEFQNPLIEYSWPRILAGDVARNIGMLFGLRGAASVIPLVLLAVITFGLIWRSTRPVMKETRE